MQILGAIRKKRLLCRKSAIFVDKVEKTPFLAFPEAIKANWRSQLHAQSSQMYSIPLGPSEKFLLCKSTKKARYVRSLGNKPHFGAFPRGKKVLLSAQSVCARLRTGPIIMQIPRGYQKKKFIV